MFFEYELNSNIHYNISGNGENKILFLHGWACDGKIFDPIIRDLNEEFKCITVDFPAHGKSSEPERVFKVEDFSKAIIKLLDNLNIKKINVVAHSFGARVAIWIASHYPNYFDKIIITGGAGIVLKKKTKSMKNYIYKFQKNALNLLSKLPFLNKNIEDMQESLVQKYGSSDYKVLSKNMRKTFVAVISEDLTPLLNKIKSSTLLIWGSNDLETPVEYANIMNKNIADSAIVIFEGRGHFAFIDEYKRFTKILISFFGEK